MNLILIGLGPHAKRIYIKFLKKYNIIPKLLVDLDINHNKIKNFLIEQNLEDVPLYLVPNEEKDNQELSLSVQRDLSNIIDKEKITHAIISTEPKAHLPYAMFLLKNHINILMDKPITAPTHVISNPNQAKQIEIEYNLLCEEYQKQKKMYPSLNFSIQCQRRFHKGYIYVKNILLEIIKKYNIPITYIDIYHNDGMWNMPDEFVFRENHPYKYGYGKLFHSGYHFIDLLVWLLDVNSNLNDKKINNCSVYAESYRPNDFFYNFNNKDYNNILHSNKFEKIIHNSSKFENYGEIDVHSIVNFYNNDHLVTNCSLNLMQSGFSRRSWVELPEDTYKSNGRVRHERLNIQIGPLLNIQVHSYQAYEIKERNLHNQGEIGDLEHFDIYIFRNTDLIGGKPFEKVTLSKLEGTEKDNKFMGYNERARERCFLDFIHDKENASNILLHKQSIIITTKIYQSLIYGGKKMKFNFDLEKTKDLNKNIATITDKDFNIEEKINQDNPIIRVGARGIITNDNGEIAIIYKKNKNEYKLPGGGVEDGENTEIAFKRECEEELGCQIEILEKLGTVEEYKSQENFKQLSFVYLGYKKADLEANKLTTQEQEEGTRFIWLPKTEALDKMRASLNNLKSSKYDNVYRTRFMVLRDIKILEYYLNR